MLCGFELYECLLVVVVVVVGLLSDGEQTNRVQVVVLSEELET